MATSGTDTYNLTRDQIIRAAYEMIGVATANEDLSSEEISVATVALNALSLAWKGHGLHLWKRRRYTLSSSTTPALTASTYEYSFGNSGDTNELDPLRILDISRVDSDGNETELTRLSLQEYEALPNKTTVGTPLNFYFEPRRYQSILYLWPAPDASFVSDYSIQFVAQVALNDMDVGTEEVDFPNEWFDALILNLAARLAPRYGLGIPERQMLEGRADKALELALAYDVEDTSIFFQPDRRGY